MGAQNTVELPSDLFSKHTQDANRPKEDEIPELLNFTQNKNRTNINPINSDPESNHNTQRYDLSPKLLLLLKNIQNEAGKYDKNELKELLKTIGANQNNGVSDKNVMEFVNFVNSHNSEDLELDSNRLKDVLVDFQKELVLEKHRDFGLNSLNVDIAKKNGRIEADLKKYHLPSTFGLEQLIHKNIVRGAVESKPHNHHIGDEIHAGVDAGKLVKGPHGSMILSPTVVEEKLNIDSDVLKPNHDGVVIAYQNLNHKIDDE